MAPISYYIQQFVHYFWQHYRLKLVTLAVITALAGALYFVGLADEKSYLWVNVISEELNF